MVVGSSSILLLVEIFIMSNTQQTLDNIPTPIKSIFLRALNIAISALKTDMYEYDGSNAELIESMQFIEKKLS